MQRLNLQLPLPPSIVIRRAGLLKIIYNEEPLRFFRGKSDQARSCRAPRPSAIIFATYYYSPSAYPRFIITDAVFQDHLLSPYSGIWNPDGESRPGGTWMVYDLIYLMRRVLVNWVGLYKCYYSDLVFAWLELNG